MTFYHRETGQRVKFIGVGQGFVSYKQGRQLLRVPAEWFCDNYESEMARGWL